jgi:hypothetical protein
MIMPGFYKCFNLPYETQRAEVVGSNKNGAIGWIHFRNIDEIWPQAWDSDGYAVDEEGEDRDPEFDLVLESGPQT